MLDEREERWRAYLVGVGHGQPEALAQLYQETAPSLHGLALRILNNPADAEEVVLEVFEQVWRSASKYDASKSRVLWWLSMVTRSRALDRLRSTKRRGAVEEPSAEAFEMVDRSERVDETILLSERRQKVREALSSLPADQRRAVELAFFSDLSHAEIADHLGIPLGTIKTRIRTALRRLRTSLDPGDEAGDEVMGQTA